MTLTVEDGTGLANAESYISVTDTDTYFTNVGNASWTGTTAVKEAALRKATQYLDATYSWIGSILDDDQALGWPRVGVTDKDGRDLEDQVPVLIERATAELALASLSEDLLSNTDNSDYVKREQIEGLEVEYFGGAPTGKEYKYVDRLLSSLYTSKSGGSTIKLVRA